MSAKKNKGIDSVFEKKIVSPVQPLLQIDPIPKRRSDSKAHRDLWINPQIYPRPVVEIAMRLIDPRDFEVSWAPEQSMGHLCIHISAKGYEHDTEELEYYFYRKLILASTTHYSQQMHAEIRTLFMQTAHNVTRQTWQALGWTDTFTEPHVEVKEGNTASESPELCDYHDISYTVDGVGQKLLLYIETEVYGLPDVLSASAKMRRTGWDVKVQANSTPIQVGIKLKNDDIMNTVMQFYNGLNTPDTQVSLCTAAAENGKTLSMEGHPEGTNGQKIDVKIHPQIFSLPTIQLAALLVSDRFHVKIDGDLENRVIVSLKPKAPTGLISIKSVFYEALVQASLDEYKLAYYEPIRMYFLKVALSFGAALENAPLPSFFRMHECKNEKIDYQICVDDSEIYVLVSKNERARLKLLTVAWRLRSKSYFVFEQEGTHAIRATIQPKANIQLDALKSALRSGLQSNHIF